MATKKSSSRLFGLKNVINTPRFGKSFKILMVLLIVVSIAYGGYTVINERYGAAASSKALTWFPDSKDTLHFGGWASGHRTTGGNRKTWQATYQHNGQVIWAGPYKHVSAGQQYLGCFYYYFGSTNSSAAADVVIWNNGVPTIPNSTVIKRAKSTNFNNSAVENFDRTCLSFYVPKSLKKNGVELRVHSFNAGGTSWRDTLHIMQTKISKLPAKNSKLSNTSILNRKPDNKTIIQGSDFK